ncbi:MAG: sigma-70 family RNA polymerase sigma factor [Sedimentisphaerales bacterium]|nr:sigma-70 family RNA polymerase sigma factor [Sedimentisphaerales bacterium]
MRSELDRYENDNWLDLLRLGDHQAFGEFIDKYKETVFLCCRRLGLRVDEVEDVASEVFIAAYKGLARYGGRAELGTWIWSIAYRKGIDYLRKNRRLGQLDSEACQDMVESRAEGPVSAVQNKELEEMVWEAVERLPRLWSLAVVLYYREEKSLADIATIMDSKENTIKTYLFRGRRQLKEMLAGPFFGENAHGDS